MNTNSGHSERPKITKDQIRTDLRKMGITEGDHVAVTLSFKSIGFVNGGPDAFIDALLEVVGPEGTIMMNTFTLSFPIAEIPSDYVFDPASTVPYTGLVPKTLMKRDASVRSRHPTGSVVSIGRLAEYLTKGHDEKSNAYLPYERLAQINGKYLCIGLGDRLVAIRHEAQRRAGLFIVPFLMGVLYKNKEGVSKLFIWVHPPCPKNLHALGPIVEKKGILRRGKIGSAASIVAPASELIDAMITVLKEDPTVNLCDDIFCVRCRELERRLNLYGKIANPMFFQKSKFMRKLLSSRNNLVLLRRYSRVSFKNSSWRKKVSPNVFLEIALRRTIWIIYKIINRQ
jgi:aminoglycoside N3'-acetyltransferase